MSKKTFTDRPRKRFEEREAIDENLVIGRNAVR